MKGGAPRMHISIVSPTLVLRAALAAALVGPLACYSDPAMQADDAGATTAGGSEPATTGPAAPTTSADVGTDAGDDSTTGPAPDCYSTRDFFADKVWAPLMSSNCAMCHEPTGVAAEKGAKFRLLTAVYPGFIEANLENIKSIKGYEYEGIPLLLAKPTLVVDHGGGKVLQEDSELYDNVAELLVQLEDPVECPAAPPSAAFPDVELLTPAQTLRKAALHLVGRLPTADEAAAVASGGEPALRAALDALMTEDAFYDRLADIYNDIFFTDTYLVRDGVGTLNATTPDWPNVLKYFDKVDPLPPEQMARIKRAVSREPLALVQYIVRNDQPFTDILLAPYTVFTPDSAFLYGVDLKFSDPADPDELQPGTLKVTRNGKELTFPHAGVLTSPMWLNRFPTTPTNRNRHRARMVYKQFLATDILRIGERPIDPTQSLDYTNPTREDGRCTFCHQQIDPIAGTFQNWDDYDQEKLVPGREWYPEMYPPGFNGEDLTKAEFPKALPWLGQHAADDPRFVVASVYTVYRGLTGQEPLLYPADPESPTFKTDAQAWEAQDSLLRKIGDDFVAADYNLKTIIEQVILSPYYRGVTTEDEPDEEMAQKLAAVGTARLSTPELLSRKIEAVTGIRWLRPWDLSEYLRTDYKILYGGIDSDTITQRLPHMNGIMAGVASRMANEVACASTAWDFSRPADQRKLFPKVTLDHIPLGPTGDEIPDAIADIKANIQHLHSQILGEELEVTDPEIERTYNLFLETWKEGSANVAAGTENEWLSWWCQARVDPNTQVDLPEAEKINTDKNYTIRAWMAVTTLLLSDYDFLYE